MGWLTTLSGYITPAFLILSPLLSYSDQAYSMYRNRSSAGFSLDIPLIMLVASFMRIFYYPGAKYDRALLIQSFVMVGMQLILLKIGLDHRPPPYAKGGDAATPFSRVHETRRPFNFWQWRSPKPYWQFLLALFISLCLCEFLLAPLPWIYSSYSPLIGFIGLGVEAVLPIPQILANHRSQSCKGFRVSVLASWLIGDAMKMFWFFTSKTTIPLAFKLCGTFQAFCDAYLGIQYAMYGDKETGAAAKGHGHGHGASWQHHQGHELKANGFSTASLHENRPGRRTSSAAERPI
ncbi:hypothetical protein VTJ04DRAFT_6239 [Mycothermus thermophilus]|uniref:uncharacterized protein n=1 Tax=Humicola insolens TaxID=85995 RepID=UPI00374306DD